MKRFAFFENHTRNANADSSLVRCFGIDPSVFRTTAALHWWGPEVEFFSDNSYDRH